MQVEDDESFIANGIVVHNCLISLGMNLWILESSFKKLQKLEKQTKAILSSWMIGANNSTPIVPEVERGSGFVPVATKNKSALPKPKFSSLVSRNMQDPTGQFAWLFSGMK